MRSGLTQHADSARSRLARAGQWLFLTGVFLMVTGDGPASTVRLAKWATPVPALSWAWLHLIVLAIAALVLAAAGLRVWRASRVAFLVRPVAFLLSAFLVSTLLSSAHRLSAEAFLLVLVIAGFGWLSAAVLEDDRARAHAWPVVATALLLLAIRVILWRRDEGLDVVAYQIFNNAWIGKLQLAWIFNLFAPLLLARALGEHRPPWAAFYGLTWVLCGIATYVLFSRMGWVVFGLTTVGVCLLNHAYWRRWLLIMVLTIGLAAGLFSRAVHTSREVASATFESERNPGLAMRLGAWRDALRLFRDHPIAGTGLGTFDEATFTLPGTTADPQFRQQGWHAHNVYLHLLAETGLLGFLAWCYLWFAVLAQLVRTWRRAGPHQRLDTTGALCAVLAFLVLATTEVLIGAHVHASLRMNMTIAFVVVLGVLSSSPEGDTPRPFSALEEP